MQSGILKHTNNNEEQNDIAENGICDRVALLKFSSAHESLKGLVKI